MNTPSSHDRPRSASTDAATAYLGACRVEVDHALERFLPAASEEPALVMDAMRYSVFAGGKRLRPSLALAAADSTTQMPPAEVRRLVLPVACAIEMIHTYSLIHDDLPSMDDDTLRRGRPTAHVVYGEGLAILAGDGLLTEAFRILARCPETGPTSDANPTDDAPVTTDTEIARRRLRVLERIAAGAGVGGMVGGQVIDLEAAGKVLSPHRDTSAVALDAPGLQGMHEKKTGALIRAAAVAGSVIVGATEAETDAVDSYARHLGLGFQIVDDILDVEGEAEQLGKTVGKDAADGKPTYPALFGVDTSRRMAREAIEAAHTRLDHAGIRGPLSAIADWVLARTH